MIDEAGGLFLGPGRVVALMRIALAQGDHLTHPNRVVIVRKMQKKNLKYCIG
jgi:hypothetical protein